MSPIRIERIAHIVLFVKDPEASARWYCDVLNMTITARAGDGPYKGGVFMSFGDYDHDLAFFPAAATDHPARFEHIGLEVDCAGDLDQLRRLYGRMLSKGVRIHEVLNHGVSIGIYFYDPDGLEMEVFCQMVPPTGGAALAELHRNQGQADVIELEPLYD